MIQLDQAVTGKGSGTEITEKASTQTEGLGETKLSLGRTSGNNG